MSALKSVKIGENIYKVEPFAPREAISFGLKTAKVIGPLFAGVIGGEEESNEQQRMDKIFAALKSIEEAQVEEIMMQAFARAFSPKGEPFDNEANFNAWFKDHKGEMFEAGLRSIIALAEDFLPVGLKL